MSAATETLDAPNHQRGWENRTMQFGALALGELAQAVDWTGSGGKPSLQCSPFADFTPVGGESPATATPEPQAAPEAQATPEPTAPAVTETSTATSNEPQAAPPQPTAAAAPPAANTPPVEAPADAPESPPEQTVSPAAPPTREVTETAAASPAAEQASPALDSSSPATPAAPQADATQAVKGSAPSDFDSVETESQSPAAEATEATPERTEPPESLEAETQVALEAGSPAGPLAQTDRSATVPEPRAEGSPPPISEPPRPQTPPAPAADASLPPAPPQPTASADRPAAAGHTQASQRPAPATVPRGALPARPQQAPTNRSTPRSFHSLDDALHYISGLEALVFELNLELSRYTTPEDNEPVDEATLLLRRLVELNLENQQLRASLNHSLAH